MKKLLRKIKRFLDKPWVLGTSVDEFYWKFLHIYDKKWAKDTISKKSVESSYREFLIDKISNYFPFQTVLEVGCASGPNLYLLAKKFPNAKFYGTDISKNAIKTGQDYFKGENIKNIFLDNHRAEDLKKFKDKSIDVTFTAATIVCIGPDKINSVLKELVRVTKKVIIFSEWHADSQKPFYIDHWIYNYRLLFEKFLPSPKKIEITKISSKMLDDNWVKYGHIIEVVL